MEHMCEGLKPGCSYQTRVYCMSEGGQSPVSHSASAHVPAHTHSRTRPGVSLQEFKEFADQYRFLYKQVTGRKDQSKRKMAADLFVINKCKDYSQNEKL